MVEKLYREEYRLSFKWNFHRVILCSYVCVHYKCETFDTTDVKTRGKWHVVWSNRSLFGRRKHDLLSFLRINFIRCCCKRHKLCVVIFNNFKKVIGKFVINEFLLRLINHSSKINFNNISKPFELYFERGGEKIIEISLLFPSSRQLKRGREGQRRDNRSMFVI